LELRKNQKKRKQRLMDLIKVLGLEDAGVVGFKNWQGYWKAKTNSWGIRRTDVGYSLAYSKLKC